MTLQEDAARSDGADGGVGDDQDSAESAALDSQSASDVAELDSLGASDVTRLDSPTACAEAAVSSLAGVTLRFPQQPSTFTLAQAARGISFAYDVVVGSDVPNVIPASQGACVPPDTSGLFVHEVISGNGQNYCLCDQGLCVQSHSQGTVLAGTYPHTVDWGGKNWNGPSDTGNPKGPPFPTGHYTLTVDAKGTVSGQPFEARAQFCFTLGSDGSSSFDGGGCGDAQCTASQVCVQPSCCPSCSPPPDGGLCPAGSSMGRCPIGGFMTCVAPCNLPAPHCADPPALCPADPPCTCLVSQECGGTGGTCSSLGALLQCNGCF